MAVQWQHANGPGKISGKGRNGTPVLDFERLTTGQLVLVSVDFVIDPQKSVGFEIVAADGATEANSRRTGTCVKPLRSTTPPAIRSKFNLRRLDKLVRLSQLV